MVEARKAGFRPTVSERGPPRSEPDPMPNRYKAVDKFSVTFEILNSWLACALAMDSAAPAQACVKTRSERTAMFLHRAANGQFLGSIGSSSEEPTTHIEVSWVLASSVCEDSTVDGPVPVARRPFSGSGTPLDLVLTTDLPILRYCI